VAFLCCKSLGLEEAEFERVTFKISSAMKRFCYAESIPDKSAKNFRAADQIIRAGSSGIELVIA